MCSGDGSGPLKRVPRADSLSLGHLVMDVLKLQRRHQRHCPSPMQTRSALDSSWSLTALWSKLNVAMHPVELQIALEALHDEDQ